jgi:MFS family permease
MATDSHPDGEAAAEQPPELADELAGELVSAGPYAALRERNFLYFLLGHILSVLGVQMQTVAVGWQLYEKTGSAWSLGLVGLVMAVPMIGLAPIAGQTADRFDRRKVLMLATCVAVISSSGLAYVSGRSGVGWIYACLLGSGLARAFQGPARSSLMPLLVPRRLFANSVTWAVSGFELASMIGPALGGILIATFGGATLVYLTCALGSLCYLGFLGAMRGRNYSASGASTATTVKGRGDLRNILAGFEYVWSTRLLLTTMTLDLFAVVLGGAVALLPIYAKDILKVGPTGLGWLQAAPPLGAVTMALIMAHLPPMRRAGRVLLIAVAGFGMATVVFGLSKNFWLSLVMLFLTGVFDNISVVIRQTMLQLLTPDRMRGRVSAVNGMFINASNEIGRFESGAVAGLFGPVFSVVSGGIGCLIVVAAVALRSPELRSYGSLVAGKQE